MTTRKENMIRRESYIGQYSQTFSALLALVNDTPELAGLTARQTAAVLDLLYQQKEFGRAEMLEEI